MDLIRTAGLPIFTLILSLFSASASATVIGIGVGEPALRANGSTSIQVFEDWSYNFRDRRTANRSGYRVGDRIAFGIQRLTPNPEQGVDGDQTTVTGTQNGQSFAATYTPSGGVFNGEFFRSIPRPEDGSLDGAWTMRIENPTTTNSGLEYQTNSIAGAGTVNFVSSMSLSGEAQTPTFTWLYPEGPLPDSVRLTIHDTTRDANGNLVNPQNPDDPLEDQYAKIVHLERNLNASTPTYTTPEVLTDGTSIIPGHTYDVGIQTNRFNNDGFLISRSRAFFGFTPVNAGGSEVFLPSVDPDGGVYEFNVIVSKEIPLILDPLVAIGYDYAIGVGDPLFSSVRILTDAGDGLYDLFLYDALLDDYIFERVLAVGELFDFGLGGIDRFRIAGIEIGAMLDPFDVTAFMTEVAFEDAGRFTGTMTPIVVDTDAVVSEPGLLALFGIGLVGMLLGRRRCL